MPEPVGLNFVTTDVLGGSVLQRATPGQLDVRRSVRASPIMRYPRWPVFLLALVFAGACGGQPANSEQPTASGQPNTTGQPTTSGQPTASGQPTPSGGPTPSGPSNPPPSGIPTEPPITDPTDPFAGLPPLPEPTLTTVDEIFQAMGKPGAEEQVVVSVLDLLGIGLYRADGTPIRVGRESSDADLYLWEPEARGLVNMLRAEFTDDGWIEFRDFHAVLAEYGYSGSAEELAAEYLDLPAAEPGGLISQLIGYVDADAPISKFSAWLLFVDGFVRHSGEAARMPALARTSSRGIAQLGGPLIMDPNVIAHLMLVAASAQPTITFAEQTVHEGHGVPAPPIEIKAHVRAVAVTWVSPFTGASLIPLRAFSADGIRVEFEGNRAITKHGTLSDPFEFTDANGDAIIGYGARIEPLNGMGVEVSTIGIVTARVNVGDVMTQLYGQPALAALAPVSGIAIGQIGIEWHDEPPMQIDFTHTYNLELPFEIMGSAQTAGQDTISGDLIVDEDDPTRWEGTALASATGSFSGELAGQSCYANWDVQQILHVTGLEDPSSGEMLFVFQPLGPMLGDPGDPRCNTSRPPSPDGIAWAPFNDLGVTDPTIGLRFNVAIPRPGFLEARYPTPLAGTGVAGHADWLVKIEFVSP